MGASLDECWTHLLSIDVGDHDHDGNGDALTLRRARLAVRMSIEISARKIDKGKARQHDEDEEGDLNAPADVPSQSQGRDQDQGQSRGQAVFLPSEIVLEVIRILQAQWLTNSDPQAERALIAFSQTNKLVREWALDALYEILILPRHVREFRKFYQRQRTSYRPFTCAGYTRALFCGLDDVSRLTATTAGWESELMRLLHYAGPHLDYLSLWNAESRVILRDPIQVKGHRTAGARSTSQWDDASLDDVDFPTASASSNKQEEEDPLPNVHDLPGWLRAEYERLPLREFYRRHKAHVAFRSKTSDVLMVQQRQRGCRPRFLSMVISFPFYENEAENAFPHMTIWSRVEELDFHVPVTKDVGRVLKLTSLLHRSPLRRIRISSQHASIAIALPPFSPNEPTRTATSASSSSYPSHNASQAPAAINLARGLGRIHASCVLLELIVAEFQGHHAPRAELERLQAVLEAAVLSEAQGGPRLSDGELWRRANGLGVGEEEGSSGSISSGSRASDGRKDPTLPLRMGSLASTLGVGLQISDGHHNGSGFHLDREEFPPGTAPWERFPSASYTTTTHPAAVSALDSGTKQEHVRIRIQQRGQDVHGKLRVRLQDFRERAEFGAPGSWATMGVWDEG
ncbi:unnamed protein product [Tilletia controversa]|uniref:F-box domain-containing protein n=3 Tax=Tilletia TaxID=13289 RepID=A0ABN7J9W7_9BASI|nr:unnamed protein product [Tilletia controversa]CAD6961596.1 unnamed protein product [Tilletia caries]CAD7060536.1 unnamed protein product [Tilletia caries]